MDTRPGNHIPASQSPARQSRGADIRSSDWAELDVRSEEVQEIIGRPPHGLVRWGITVFAGAGLLVLSSAWIIRSPDSIHAPLRLTAIQAPVSVEARTAGKLVRLLAGSGQAVEQGQVLAWLESTASHETVLELSGRLEQMEQWLRGGELERFASEPLDGFVSLGGLQSGFQVFEQAMREFVAYLPGGFYHRRREMLERELGYNGRLLEQLHRQQQIQQDDYELALREFEIQQRLAEGEFISPMELARAERELSARELPLQQTESAIIGNHLSRAALRKELMDLDRRIEDQRAVFLQELNSFRSLIGEWKTTYLLVSPIEGRVIHAGIFQQNQTVEAGRRVFYIQPESADYFGEVGVGQASIGKISEGQSVLVRFSGYPDQEYGSVRGRLDYLSDIPVRDSLFMGKVTFPEGLVTNYGRVLTPRDGMRARAEILTQEMRLLERLYNNIAHEIR